MGCLRGFTSAPSGQALTLSVFFLFLFSVSPATASQQALAEPDHLVIREAKLTRAEAGEEPGMIWLEMAEKEPGDPADAVRIQAILAGRATIPVSDTELPDMPAVHMPGAGGPDAVILDE